MNHGNRLAQGFTASLAAPSAAQSRSVISPRLTEYSAISMAAVRPVQRNGSERRAQGTEYDPAG